MSDLAYAIGISMSSLLRKAVNQLLSAPILVSPTMDDAGLRKAAELVALGLLTFPREQPKREEHDEVYC